MYNKLLLITLSGTVIFAIWYNYYKQTKQTKEIKEKKNKRIDENREKDNIVEQLDDKEQSDEEESELDIE